MTEMEDTASARNTPVSTLMNQASGPAGDGPDERAEGHSEPFDEARQGRAGKHQKTTFRTPVTMMLAKESGMRIFHANCWSWSSRNRG